jgi:hypothetical protein
MSENHGLMFQNIKSILTELCVDYGIRVPKIMGSDNMNFTDPQEQQICVCPSLEMSPQEQAHHIFGHYLGDLHELSPDLVANTIAKIIQNTRSQN